MRRGTTPASWHRNSPLIWPITDPQRRAQVADILRPIVADYLARFETLTDDQYEILSSFAGDLVDLADPEARPLIEQALAEDKIDTDQFDLEYLEETYAQGGHEPHMKPSPWLDRYRQDYERHRRRELTTGAGAGAGTRRPGQAPGPQRPLLVRQRQEVQEVPPDGR